MDTNDKPALFAAQIAKLHQTTQLSIEVAGSNGARYTVNQDNDGSWRCTCKAFEFGHGKPCKHILHVQELQEWESVLYEVKRLKESKDDGASTNRSRKRPVES